MNWHIFYADLLPSVFDRNTWDCHIVFHRKARRTEQEEEDNDIETASYTSLPYRRKRHAVDAICEFAAKLGFSRKEVKEAVSRGSIWKQTHPEKPEEEKP